MAVFSHQQLPCGHEFCKSCVAQLKQKGLAQTCPLCRKPLPPGPESLFDLGSRVVLKIEKMVEQGKASWESLTAEQQREMDEALPLLRESADQGHPEAQAYCGDMYGFGWGVAKDERTLLVYGRAAVV